MNKLVLAYKDSSRKGTRLIPVEDVCSARSVDAIASYYASDDYRRLNESIERIAATFIRSKEAARHQAKEKVKHSIATSPLRQKMIIEVIGVGSTEFQVNESDWNLLFHDFINSIDDSLLPQFETKLASRKYFAKFFSKPLIKNKNFDQIQKQMLDQMQQAYKQAIKLAIIKYSLLNKKAASQFCLNQMLPKNRRSFTIRAPVPWHESFIEARNFNKKFNYTCDPVIVKIIKIWGSQYSGCRVLPIDCEANNWSHFKGNILVNCQKLRSKLIYEWISTCSNVVIGQRADLVGVDSIRENRWFEAMASLMSRLLRQLVIDNIENWIQIVTRFSDNCVPLFDVDIELADGIPCFVPAVTSWQDLLFFPINQIIYMNQEVPRIENQLILMKPKNYRVKFLKSVEINDFKIDRFKTVLIKVLSKELNGNSVLKMYNLNYMSFLNSIKNIASQESKISAEDVIEIVNQSREIKEKLVYQAKRYSCGIFNINCGNLNQDLIELTTTYTNQIVENKVKKILDLAKTICMAFVDIEKDMEKNSESTWWLVNQMNGMEEYRSKICLLFKDIEYIEDQWEFLAEECAYFVNDADFELLHNLYNWPSRIQLVSVTNEKRLNKSKEEADERLKIKVSDFASKLAELERILNEFKRKRLSSPIENIKENVKLLDGIQQQLNLAKEERETIKNEEMMLTKVVSSEFCLLDELIQRKKPLDIIWKTADEFRQKQSKWMGMSLKKLDVNEVRESLNLLLSSTLDLVKEFESQADIHQNVVTLQVEIDSFKRKYIPLIQVLCNPVLHERHWRRISDILGQQVTPESCRTLTDVVQLTPASQHITEIEQLGEIAIKEHALQVFLEKMKTEWLEEWPKDALEIAANKFLEGEHFSSDLKEKCAAAFKYIHQDAKRFIGSIEQNEYKVAVDVTPPLFIELILTFKDLFKKKQREISAQKARYSGGVGKLELAGHHVEEMRNKLINEYQPQLVIASHETEELMIKIEKETVKIETQKEIIAADQATANKSAASAQQIKDECTKDLSEVYPAIRCAIEALDTLKAEDITFLKAMKNPPSGIKMVLEAVCIIKGVQPDRKLDPKGSGRIIDDYWTAALKMLSSDIKFLDNLKNFHRDNISRDAIEQVRTRYLHSPQFDPEALANVSVACQGLAKWVKAIDIYDRVVNVVKPKKGKLSQARSQLGNLMDSLDNKKKLLQQISDRLQQINDQFAAMSKRKKELEEKIQVCSLKLERAQQLIEGLESEKKRWKAAVRQLSIQDEHVVGDILLAAAAIVYTSSLDAGDRKTCLNQWQNYLNNKCNLSVSQPFSIINVLGAANEMQTWTMAGLGTDQFSIENAIIVQNAKRFPFIIDSCQGVASKWIRRLHRNIQVIDYQQMKDDSAALKATLFDAISCGNPLMICNVDQKEFDPALASILKKQLVFKDGIQHLNWENQLTQYSPEFKLYLTTRQNVHLSPIASTLVNLVNWRVDRLARPLETVVNSTKAIQFRQQADNEKQLKELEDRILQALSTTESDVLEDENAIRLLVSYKELAQKLNIN